MNHFSVSAIGDELYGTYDDGKHRLVVRQKATDDFVFDCACIIDTISVKITKLEKDKKEN